MPNLSGATIPAQSRPGSHDNKEELDFPQISIITGASSSDFLVSYPRHSLGESCYILTFDPGQKYYSKVIHRKEVTHSNGQ